MTNIILTVFDRYRLTEQTLQSLTAHTNPEDYNLTIVDNGSTDFRMLKLYEKYKAANISLIAIERPTGYVGKARNLGAYWSEQVFGRGHYICFLDNDLYLHPNWLDRMGDLACAGDTVVGGHQHPFHHTRNSTTQCNYVDAVAGYSMMMHSGLWNSLGPFISNATGPGQSEDSEFCQRVRDYGGACVYAFPPVLEHCGITNSKGEPAIGADQFRRVAGVIYE